MRRGTGLRRRPVATNTAKPTPVSSDPNVDPPIVARLVKPLLQLRASLGSGVSVPDPSIVRALTTSSNQAADTEAPHRDGVQALESTWTGPAADAAVPALRTTRTQIGDISDRGPEYLAVLADAQGTSSRAAHQVDGIIYNFRQDSRAILSNANAAPDTDAVIARASQALHEAITAVNHAKTEMDGHTRKLTAMGPLTMTTPGHLSDVSQDYTPTSTSDFSSNTPDNNSYSPNDNYTPDNNTNTAPQATVANGTPLDPATAAQLQLQEQLINAGVSLGSDGISAGVNLGNELIDQIAQVGENAIQSGAQVAEQVIPQLVQQATNPAASGSGSGASPAMFNFGGGQGQGAGSGSGSGSGSGNTGLGSVLPSVPSIPSVPAPSVTPPTPGASIPSPAPTPAPAPDPAPASQAPAPQSGPGPAAGLALPPSSGGDAAKPRDGQLGVTAPAAVEEMVPAAVIGDFGDDAI